MELLLSLAYTGKVLYLKDEEEELFGAMKMLLFGQNMNMSLFELPSKPKPSPLPSVVEVEITKEDAEKDIEMGEEDKTANEVEATSSTVKRIKCRHCCEVFSDKSTLQLHVEEVHSKRKNVAAFATAAFGEIQIVSFCYGCDTQWKTLERAQKCLSSHGLARCWVCFDVFKKNGKNLFFEAIFSVYFFFISQV